MAKDKLHTGQPVVKSGIYATSNPHVPEISLSKGDRVPPVAGKPADVTLVRETRKGK